MMLAPQLFRDIVRPCPQCETPYDVRLHAPHVLPCSHTFCLMCLSKNDQRKKRHCPICKAKYSKFAPNLALMEVSQRIDERRIYLESDTRQCDECDNRVARSLLRQCETCEKQFVTRTEYKLECIVCLECCVNSHNGHELSPLRPPPSIESSPMVQRSRRPSASSTVSVHFRQPSTVTGRLPAKGIINTIKSWSFRTSSNELSFLLTPPSKLAFSEEDIVMQCNSPFYENKPIEQQRRHQISSSRYICYEPNPDNISVDSVFAESSPQPIHVTATAKQAPHTFYNDSGVMMSTPGSSSQNTSRSLRHPSPTLQSKIQTIQSAFGTTRPPRNTRIRMGVTDLVNTPRRPLPLYTSTPNPPHMKSTRSENSVFPPTPTRRHY